MKTVIYRGEVGPIEFADDTFRGCDQLRLICVPPKFNDETFCGLGQFCRHDSCESFLHNHCFEPLCSDRTPSMVERENATEWERKSTDCYKYQCHNESGPIYWNYCNKADEICENGQCIAKEKDLTSPTVEIELEGPDLTNFNMSEIQAVISNLTNIEADELRIRVETNDKDEIVRIIIIVHDETKAIDIRDTIDQCRN